MENNISKGYRLGYVYLYMPNHHRAADDGTVYEHIVEAEKMLGRDLYPEEVVHHKDHNRQNNSHDNLMVFATNADHSIFHQTNKCELIGDHYVGISNYTVCPICGKSFRKNRNQKCCSPECSSIYERKVNRPTREELKNDLLCRNFCKIANKYGVTDNSIRKWCRAYNLPDKTSILNSMSNEEIILQ